MPLTAEHKQQSRQRIVTCARHLFNQHGFAGVTIDEIMEAADMTRGGFYKHFTSKAALYEEALNAYARLREKAATKTPVNGPDLARYIIETYVSREHLSDIDGQCPLIALSSDAARSDENVRRAYQRVLEALIDVFQSNLGTEDDDAKRRQSLAAASVCVGAMVLARTVPDASLADDICEAAREHAVGSICQ